MSRTFHSQMPSTSRRSPWLSHRTRTYPAPFLCAHLTKPCPQISTPHLPSTHHLPFQALERLTETRIQPHSLKKLTKSHPPSVNYLRNLITTKYLNNRSLTLQILQIPKSATCGTCSVGQSRPSNPLKR